MGHHLRAVTAADRPRLAALLAMPAVYRFLCDGAPPPDDAIDAWMSEGLAPVRSWLGLWLLEDDAGHAVGCVRLSAPEDPAVASAELTYLLDLAHWGEGLATRMATAAIDRAFAAGAESIVAGADAPNTGSIRVMERLGLRFLRNADYPAGPGVEYVLHRDDERPVADPVPIPFLD